MCEFASNLVRPQLCLCMFALLLVGADWLQFRGTDSNAVAPNAEPPTTWNETSNLAWKKSLPGKGVSSPIVVDGRVIVTSSSGPDQNRLHVLCFAAADGETLWQRQYWATG